jgi:hypothetical protein
LKVRVSYRTAFATAALCDQKYSRFVTGTSDGLAISRPSSVSGDGEGR